MAALLRRPILRPVSRPLPLPLVTPFEALAAPLPLFPFSLAAFSTSVQLSITLAIDILHRIGLGARLPASLL